MNGKSMLEALNYIDESYIEKAEQARVKKKPVLRYLPLIAAAAACLVLIPIAGIQVRLASVRNAPATMETNHELPAAVMEEERSESALYELTPESADAEFEPAYGVTVTRGGSALTITGEDAEELTALLEGLTPDALAVCEGEAEIEITLESGVVYEVSLTNSFVRTASGGAELTPEQAERIAELVSNRGE